MRMKDKVAIVAGAAWGGIGAASALRLAQEGAQVVVNTLSREAKLAETVERIQEAGGKAVPIMGDIGDEETWRKLIDTALEHFGKEAAIPTAIFVFVCIITASVAAELWQRKDNLSGQKS